MRKRSIILAFAALLLSCFGAAAQTYHTVSLLLQDAQTGEPVGFATVSLTKPNGKSAHKYGLSADDGKTKLEKIVKGTYTLKAELLGYKAYEQEIKVEKDLDLGTVKMEPDQEMLEAARVTDVGNPIIIKKDTVEYNASSFKTGENDVLEDLLKKLPGIEISESGTITYNGQNINKITIDGKTFFLDDPQLASKNLPAKMIEKVKVVRKKSEQAEFTGIDDGNETTVIDLGVRPGMMNGLIGSATVGAGHDIPSSDYYTTPDQWQKEGWRFQGNFFGGKFSQSSQISLILNGNNTNNRSFNDMAGSMMSGMRGGGGGMGGRGNFFGTGNGVTTSWMAGVNGAWDLFDNHMSLGGNYVYNGTNRFVQEASDKTTFLNDDTLNYLTEGSSTTGTYGHRFGIRMEHKFNENTSILFEPQVNFGGGSFNEWSEFSTTSGKRGQTNDGFSSSNGDNRSVSTSGRFLLRQRLGIPGRTLTFNANYSFSNNQIAGLNQSLTNEYVATAASPTQEIVNQRYDQNQRSTSLGGTLTYTEPLGNNFYVEANYSLSWNKSTSYKNTFDSGSNNPFSIGDHPYSSAGEAPNATYSNRIENRNLNQTIGANMLYQKQGLRAQVGIGVMPTKTDNITQRAGKEQTYSNNPTNFAPRVSLMYDINDNNNIRIFYNGRSAQPSTSQLMPVPDNTNPLNVSFGNPGLNPYFSHNLRAEWRFSNPKNFSSFNFNINGGVTQRPIVNASWYDTNGVQYSMPVNGPASSNINIRGFFNSPIRKSNFSISNNLSAGFSQSFSYVGGTALDTSAYYDQGEMDYDAFRAAYPDIDKSKDFARNRLQSFNASDRLRATYRDDNIEIQVGASTSTNKSWYTTGSASTNWMFNNQASASVLWNMPAGFTVRGEANYNWYNGYTVAKENELILNAYIQKTLGKFTLTLHGFDLLNQAKNISVTNTANNMVQTRNNTLGRYVILSVSYRFGNFGGRSARGFGGGGRGGMGGGRGGMGGGGRF